jgi:hypothetical protein
VECSTSRESEGGKKRDKKIVTKKLIIKNKGTTTKNFSLLGKSLGLILLASNPGIDGWYFGFWEEGLPLLLDILWGRWLECSFFLLSLVLWAIH